jgi:predicted nucleic acid-binding protein
VTLVVDAGAVVAMHDRRDPMQAAAERVLRDEPGELVLPAQVTAEIDYLLARRGGPPARLLFLEDLAAGRYRVECLEPADYGTVARLERTYQALSPGLADLSIVVLAERFGTTRVATFDERHFRAIAPLGGGAFTLLPTDA